jgi:GNAT superfamily N-acetyltransferase
MIKLTSLVESIVKVSEIQSIIRDKYKDILDRVFIFKHDGWIELSILRISPPFKNKGYGTRIMQDIIDYADDNNIIVTLTPSSDFGSNKNRLTQFYRRFGFVLNRGANKFFQSRDALIRYPKK